jgi:hypothetical protein
MSNGIVVLAPRERNSQKRPCGQRGAECGVRSGCPCCIDAPVRKRYAAVWRELSEKMLALGSADVAVAAWKKERQRYAEDDWRSGTRQVAVP